MRRFIFLLCAFFTLACNLAADELRFYVLTIPKSGTFLVRKLFGLLTENVITLEEAKTYNVFHPIYENGKLMHVYFTDPEKNKILHVRDFRDICISNVYWAIKIFESECYPDKQNKWKYDQWLNLSFDDKLMTMIEPNDLPFSLHPYFKSTLEAILIWLETPNVFVSKFEHLVGPKGGGNATVQREEIAAIATFLEIPFTQKTLSKTCNQLFGNTHTFRSGQIGEWKKYFTEEHKEAFKKHFGEYLIEFGYEQDNNW